MKKLPMVFASLSVLVALSTGPSAWAKGVTEPQAKVAMCIGCHGIAGYQASFPEVHKVPMIAGQNADYMVAALKAYAKGERKHATMRSVAGALSEADMQEIAAYYQAQAMAPAVAPQPAQAPAQVQAILNKGGCVACHGDNFTTAKIPGTPKLAGQHADYLYVALKAYKVEGNAQIGRGNAVMAAQVKPLSLLELKQLASYLSSLPSELRTVTQPALR